MTDSNTSLSSHPLSFHVPDVTDLHKFHYLMTEYFHSIGANKGRVALLAIMDYCVKKKKKKKLIVYLVIVKFDF